MAAISKRQIQERYLNTILNEYRTGNITLSTIALVRLDMLWETINPNKRREFYDALEDNLENKTNK